MPPRPRPIPRGVNSTTYCVRQRKKTGNTASHVIEFKVKGQSRYRLSSTCAECGAKKCTFLKSGAHPTQTVSGGKIKSTESKGRKAPGSEYTVGGKLPVVGSYESNESVRNMASRKRFSPFSAVVGSIGPRWPGDFPNHVWTASDVKKLGSGRLGPL